jgi:prepilin-type N-terminal cleavage/methylation domain-containing protein
LLRRRHRGFTLVEVTIVIIIVLMLTTVSIGVYSPFRNKQAAASAMDKITMAMHKARTNAISTRYSFRVTIARQDRIFWVDRTGNSTAEQTSFNLLDQVRIDPITGETIEVGRPKVVRPEKLPDFVNFSRIKNDVPDATLDGVDYYFFIFEPDGTSPTTGGVEFLTDGSDANLDTSYYAVRVFGASGTIQQLPQARLP